MLTNTLLSLDTSKEFGLMHIDLGEIRGIYKPHGIPTTKGKQTSLLDILTQQYNHTPIIQHALQEFDIQEELGMMTRLDNDTAGMVRFVKNHHIKQQRLHDQAQKNIEKFYQADVLGRIHDTIICDTPIAHHAYDTTRMVDSNKHDFRGKIHHTQTTITPLHTYNTNTTIQVTIHQGIRHQIRLHCANMGNPIIGETLYHKGKTDTFLHLRSIGVYRKNKAISYRTPILPHNTNFGLFL